MEILKNGTIIGNWQQEKWEKIAPGVEQLLVSGKGMTLSFQRIGPEASGVNASRPGRGHRHDDVEQLTILLAGHGTVIVDGKRYPVKKGSHWLAPSGVDHTFDLCESPAEITLLQLFPGPKRPPNVPHGYD